MGRRGSFGVSMFAVLLVLMFITLSYTNLGKRHTAVDEHADPHRQHPNKHDHGQKATNYFRRHEAAAARSAGCGWA